MGRHGGGSRSGGSRSSGGSRGSSGGSGVRTSSKPFYGCYNRTYYDTRGRRHNIYTNDADYGTKSGWNAGVIFALIFLTIHMMFILFYFPIFEFGEKIEGDSSRIFIEDHSDLLTNEQEQNILELFYQIYDKSGMPITLYTTNFEWRYYYSSIEVYSEELYYKIGLDENSMIILFTSDYMTDTNFWNWEYDIYCGDNTIKCLSDSEFNKILDNFQKAMAREDLEYTLNYAFNSVIDELATTNINYTQLPIMLFLIVFYSIFYIALLSSVFKTNKAYKYFKENPDKLSMSPMTLYSECPNCGASNTTQTETCIYCGSLLKIEGNNIKFIKPN